MPTDEERRRRELIRSLKSGRQGSIPEIDPRGISFGQVPRPEKKPDPEADRRAELIQSIGRDAPGGPGGSPSDLGPFFIGGVNRIIEPVASMMAAFPTGTVPISEKGRAALGMPTPETPQLPGAADRPAETALERGAEFAGETVTLALPMARLLATIPKVGAAASSSFGRLMQRAQNFLRESGRAGVKHPVETVGIEGAAGFTGGAAGQFAAESFPDSPAARLVGEVLGGIAGPSITIPMARQAGRFVRKHFEPFSQEGVSRRAGERVDRAFSTIDREGNVVPDPEARSRALEGLEEPTTRTPEGRSVLTPAAQSGSPRALELEKAMLRESDALEGRHKREVAEAVDAVRRSFAGIVDETPETLEDPVGTAMEYMGGLVDTRVRQAAARVEQGIAQLGEAGTVEDTNRIFDQRMMEVRRDVINQESQFYDALPAETLVPVGPARSGYLSLVRRMTTTGQGEIPKRAKTFLDPFITSAKGKRKKNPQALGESATIEQLRVLYSGLREDARRALRREKNTLAANANELAESVLDSIAKSQASPELETNLRIAVAFSRNSHEILDTFTMGRLGGRTLNPSNRPVPPTEQASQSIGLTGQVGKDAFDQIVASVKLARRGGANRELEPVLDATKQYIRSKFRQDAVEGPTIDLKKATRFMKKHEQLLNEMPDVRDEFRRVMRLQREADASVPSKQDVPIATSLRDEGGRYVSPKVAKATMLLQDDPDKFFTEMTTGSRRKPVAGTMRELVKTLEADETGESLRGMRAAWLHFMLKGTTKHGRDLDVPLTSGKAMRNLLNTPQGKAITRTLFPDAGDRERIRTVVRDFVKLENQRLATAAPEGFLKDKPNVFITKAFGFAGAGAVRRMVENPAIQQTGAGADVMRMLFQQKIYDPGTVFLTAAMNEEGLFKNVLMSRLTPDGKLKPDARKRLNAWAATLLFEAGSQQRPEGEVGGLNFPLSDPSARSSSDDTRTPGRPESGADNSRSSSSLPLAPLPPPPRLDREFGP